MRSSIERREIFVLGEAERTFAFVAEVESTEGDGVRSWTFFPFKAGDTLDVDAEGEGGRGTVSGGGGGCCFREKKLNMFMVCRILRVICSGEGAEDAREGGNGESEGRVKRVIAASLLRPGRKAGAWEPAGSVESQATRVGHTDDACISPLRTRVRRVLVHHARPRRCLPAPNQGFWYAQIPLSPAQFDKVR